MTPKPKGKKILVMGLNRSGKTTFSRLLRTKLKCPYFNADDVRIQFNDFDFSTKGRNRQARRMKILCDWALRYGNEYAIADFICPTNETRMSFDPDHIIFMDTVEGSSYLDTHRMFKKPVLLRDDMRIISKGNFPEQVDKFFWQYLRRIK